MNLSRGSEIWTVLILLLVTVGCVNNQYEIELTPDGKTIQRELKCWRSTSSNDGEPTAFPDTELERIAQVYGVDVPADSSAKHHFTQRFVDQMPDDVGNRGTYTYWTTPLGSVSGYVERIRGDDDLVASVQERQQAVDRLANHLIGWFRLQLESGPEVDQFCDFVDHHLRRDLANLSLYVWAHDLAARTRDEFEPDYLARIWQYFVERSYVAPEQLPELARAVRELEQEDPTRLLAIIQRFAASKMGVPENQPIPDYLQFLADPNAIESSLDAYLRQTDVYCELLAQWEQAKRSDPDAKKPEPAEVLTEDIGRAFMPNLYLGADQVTVRLATGNAPFLTNGSWDEDSGKVEWSQEVLEADSEESESPLILFALWSTPHTKAQQKHFGKVVMKDEQLGEYCLWYRGLSTEEAEQWDSFVMTLQPGTELIQRLSSFRFAHQRSLDNDESDLASIPRRLLVAGLQDGN